MNRFLILAPVLVLGGVIACGAGDGTPEVAAGREHATTDAAPPLEGTTWEFVEAEGEPVVRFENEDVPAIRLVAADHTLAASLSCNSFTGSYEIEGEGLRLQLTPVTWRECQASHEQEELLRRVIQTVTDYRLDDDRLVLFARSKAVAVLMPVEVR